LKEKYLMSDRWISDRCC